MGRALQSLFARIESPKFGYVSADVKTLYGLEMRKLIASCALVTLMKLIINAYLCSYSPATVGGLPIASFVVFQRSYLHAFPPLPKL